MSLINDALKRAKQAQQENPPATPLLEFRPVESGQNQNRRTTLLVVGLSLVIVTILGLAGVLVWFVSQTRPAPLPVAARVADAPLAPLPQSTPPPPAVTSNANEDMGKPEDPKTNSVPVVAAAVVEAIKPPALKLQGIFFDPNHPAAIVSGKTVYLGDRVNGFRVIGISPVAVIVANGTETNVLSLSER